MKRKKKIQAIENEDMPELSYEELALMRAQQEKREDRSRLAPHDTSEKAKLFRFVRKNNIRLSDYVFSHEEHILVMGHVEDVRKVTKE